MNRRYFIQSVAAGALAVKRSMPASDKVNLAVMGVRGRGRGLTSNFAELSDARLAYLCDVDENVFGPALKIAQAKGFQPKLIGDIRTPRPRFWLAMPARMSMWRSRRRTTSGKDA
jgi:hypothetical protein